MGEGAMSRAMSEDVCKERLNEALRAFGLTDDEPAIKDQCDEYVPCNQQDASIKASNVSKIRVQDTLFQLSHGQDQEKGQRGYSASTRHQICRSAISAK